MQDIREKISEFSNEFLLDQYHNKKHEYTPDALKIMEEEIKNRNLSDEDAVSTDDISEQERLAEFFKEEFIPFEHGFSRTDIPLAVEMLREERIPFTVEDSQISGTIPLESELIHTYTVSVPKSLFERAQTCLNQLFQKSNGQFSVKYVSTRERLKSFCFHEINLSWKEMTEEVAVHFSPEESAAINTLIKRLHSEVETIESETGKLLFYYDNLEECAEHLSEKNRDSFTKTDLLTILEVLQTYCDKQDFQQVLENTAEVLLNFFLK
jgi:hypothetical protein